MHRPDIVLPGFKLGKSGFIAKVVAVLLAATLGLAGCSDSLDYSIDNPTAAPVALVIDGKNYDIPAHAAVDVTLAVGAHTMSGSTVGDIKFIVYTGRKSGVINPTLSNYIKAREIYVQDESALKNFGEAKGTVQVNGVPFTGPFDQSDGLFIDKDWDYGVHESFPETMYQHTDKMRGNIFVKLFTSEDFIPYYEQRYEEPGYYDQHRVATAKAPSVRQVLPMPDLPVTKDPIYESHTGSLRTAYANYLKATDASQQKQIYKTYFADSTAFNQVETNLSSQRPAETLREEESFQRMLWYAFGASALVVR